MRKVFINKWFFLALFLTIGLSAFSFVAYQRTTSVCSLSRECPNNPTESNQRTDMFWDVISRQFTSFISVQ